MINKFIDALSDPRKAAYVILGLALALVFTLGIAIYEANNVRDLTGDVKTLKFQHDLSTSTAVKVCKLGKPKNTKFVNDFILYFNFTADNTEKLLKGVPKGTKLYEIRQAAIDAERDLVTTLKALLPIKCTVPDTNDT